MKMHKNLLLIFNKNQKKYLQSALNFYIFAARKAKTHYNS